MQVINNGILKILIPEKGYKLVNKESGFIAEKVYLCLSDSPDNYAEIVDEDYMPVEFKIDYKEFKDSMNETIDIVVSAIDDMFSMFEKDYIMRLVKQAVRMLLKLLFNIDTAVPIEQIIEQEQEKQLIKRLIKMVDEGEINEAENELCDIIADADRKYLKTALVFYYHLSEKSEDFLLQHDYTPQEIREGVESLVSLYGLKDLADIVFDG
jgi:hypothetical protein